MFRSIRFVPFLVLILGRAPYDGTVWVLHQSSLQNFKTWLYCDGCLANFGERSN